MTETAADPRRRLYNTLWSHDHITTITLTDAKKLSL